MLGILHTLDRTYTIFIFIFIIFGFVTTVRDQGRGFDRRLLVAAIKTVVVESNNPQKEKIEFHKSEFIKWCKKSVTMNPWCKKPPEDRARTDKPIDRTKQETTYHIEKKPQTKSRSSLMQTKNDEIPHLSGETKTTTNRTQKTFSGNVDTHF